MRAYAPAAQAMQWHTITPGNMPPIGETFLLWRAVNESDGGIPTTARRFRREGENAPIVYVAGMAEHYHALLDEADYKNCRWAAIPPPKCVVKKRIKEREKMAKLKERMME